jgi:hypothetical protein
LAKYVNVGEVNATSFPRQGEAREDVDEEKRGGQSRTAESADRNKKREACVYKGVAIHQRLGIGQGTIKRMRLTASGRVAWKQQQ